MKCLKLREKYFKFQRAKFVDNKEFSRNLEERTRKFATCAVTRKIVQHTKKERVITKVRNTENTKRISNLISMSYVLFRVFVPSCFRD